MTDISDINFVDHVAPCRMPPCYVVAKANLIPEMRTYLSSYHNAFDLVPVINIARSTLILRRIWATRARDRLSREPQARCTHCPVLFGKTMLLASNALWALYDEVRVKKLLARRGTRWPLLSSGFQISSSLFELEIAIAQLSYSCTLVMIDRRYNEFTHNMIHARAPRWNRRGVRFAVRKKIYTERNM